MKFDGTLTFGNEGSIPAQGRVFARGGVTAKKRLRLIWKEALSAVHWWLLHCSTAEPAHTAAAAATWGVHWPVDRTETLAYIHWGHQQLVDVQLQIKSDMKKKMRWERILTLIKRYTGVQVLHMKQIIMKCGENWIKLDVCCGGLRIYAFQYWFARIIF